MSSSEPLIPASQVPRIGALRQALGFRKKSPRSKFFKDTLNAFRQEYVTLSKKAGTSLYSWRHNQLELRRMANVFLRREGPLLWPNHPVVGENFQAPRLVYPEDKEAIEECLMQLIYRVNLSLSANFKSGKVSQDPDGPPTIPGQQSFITIESDEDEDSILDSVSPPPAGNGTSFDGLVSPQGQANAGQAKDLSHDDITRPLQPNAMGSQNSMAPTKQVEIAFNVICNGNHHDWFPKGETFMDKSLAQVISELPATGLKESLSRLIFRLYPAYDVNINRQQWSIRENNEMSFHKMKMNISRQLLPTWLKKTTSRPLMLLMDIELLSDKEEENHAQLMEEIIF